MKTIRFYIKELIKMYSSEKSFFSKKRIESGIAFLIGQIMMIVYFANKLPTLTTADFITLIVVEFLLAGYLVNKTELAKKAIIEKENKDNAN